MKTQIMLSPEELHNILASVFAERDAAALESLSSVESDQLELADDGAPQPRTWRAAR